MFPAIFLDRDGVIIENRAEYVREWSQVSIFPEAIPVLSSSKLENYKIVIVTNQSAVRRGIISFETAKDINDRLINVIRSKNGKVDGAYICPHGPGEDCECRKPRPGLLVQAAKELSLDLKRSWMVGDAWTDVEAGQAAGVRGTIIVRTGRGADQLLLPHPANLKDYLICDDLPHAVSAILAHDSGN